ALEHEQPAGSFLAASAPENRSKNRYRDILPYDGTRVRIGDSEDYINASYMAIPAGDRALRYICTQGPLPGTVTAFWHMVWDNACSVIVMMTQETENGKVKCERYWPKTTHRTWEADNLTLRLENCQVLKDFTVRIMRLTQKEVGFPRDVCAGPRVRLAPCAPGP
ncbi:hypothetical protein FKM82_031310, partial [Ascaphus truei]